MRDLVCAGVAAGVLALLAGGGTLAKPQPKLKPASPSSSAASAESYGVKAAYRVERGKGYTARERHMADCLATYGRYDPRTDRIEVRPGVTRPCDL